MKKIIALTLVLLMSLSCFSLVSFAEDTETTEHLIKVPEGYVGVYTKDDLYAVRENPSGKYILMNDIIFEDEDYVKGGDFYNSGAGWEPVGTSSTPFKGIFNGNNFTIFNLYVNAPDETYQGLFGYVSSAMIENINLVNVNTVGNDYVGGIVGYINTSTIQNVNLVNANIVGNDYVGGFVGYITNTTIDDCLFNGEIIGNDYLGGVTGFSNAVSTISNCCTRGIVEGEQFVGGITGFQYSDYGRAKESYRDVYNYNYITYCNNAALIKGNSNIGGITGCSQSYYKYYNYTGYGYYDVAFYGYTYIRYCSNTGFISANDSNSGGIVGCSTNYGEKCNNNIISCYNNGNISAVSNAGGLTGNGEFVNATSSYSVGYITAELNFGGCFGSIPNTVTFCYYLDDAVTNPTCTAGTAKSEDQLRKKGTYEQWDFDTVWTMDGREDYIYPELRDVPLVLPEDYSHKHEYTSETTTPATHTAEGVMTYTCECGDSYTEVIEKIAEHNYIEEITTPATHMTEGVMTFTCDCGDTYTETIKKITAHNFEATATEPTCTEHGFTTFTCECGETYTRDYVSAIGHKDSDSDYICDNGCGYEFEKTEPETPDKPEEKPCDCNCHKGGITAFFFKLINFFAKLFDKSAGVCKCGAKH